MEFGAVVSEPVNDRSDSEFFLSHSVRVVSCEKVKFMIHSGSQSIVRV